jgi:exopolysaccharide biosynthesis polyprenyl glycosylphosphotransferase
VQRRTTSSGSVPDPADLALRRFAEARGLGFAARARVHRKRVLWWAVTTATHALKRLLDASASAALGIVLAPLLGLVAVAVRLDSPGPVLFRQVRVGRYGRTFDCWKFRSMYVDAEKRRAELLAHNEMQGGVTFKMKRDPRITRVGRILRKLSIDELPQLWNVFRGEMSLVGPRPPIPSEVALYDPEERRRLEVKPGLTCLWQVSGRSDIPFDRQVQLDVAYIESQSFRGDLRILLATIPAVLLGRGAY